MIVTVPRDWVTVSNGTLQSVTDAADGQKTWTWRQSQPISSYLISLVAGEFDGVKQTWGKLPVDFYVPRGRRDRIAPTFAHHHRHAGVFLAAAGRGLPVGQVRPDRGGPVHRRRHGERERDDADRFAGC